MAAARFACERDMPPGHEIAALMFFKHCAEERSRALCGPPKSNTGMPDKGLADTIRKLDRTALPKLIASFGETEGVQAYEARLRIMVFAIGWHCY
jgi:hypothetical protein